MAAKRFGSIIVSLLFLSITVFNQKKESVIAGVVQDENGSLLAMVNVQLAPFPINNFVRLLKNHKINTYAKT